MTTDAPAPAPAPETKYVELRGVNFAYSEQGVGPVVLYAHAMTASRATERELALFDLSPIADAGFRLISYDARGHGQTTGTTNAADYSWPSLAHDLLALADHFSPGEAVSIVGSSMGTATALHAVVEHPNRFNRLVLTAPPTAWETRAGQAKIYEALAQVVENSTEQALTAMFASAAAAPIFADVPNYPPALGATSELLPSIFRGAGMSDLPDAHSLRLIRQRALVMPWATDPGHPLSTAERLVELLDHAELHVSSSSADIATWGARAAAFLSDGQKI